MPKEKPKMLQTFKKSIKGQIVEAVARRYQQFENSQEIHLDKKEFKALLKEINHRYSDGSKPDPNAPIVMSTWWGKVKISNRDNVENFANREQY